MKRFIKEYGHIDEMLFELLAETLDHIKVSTDGEAHIEFLYGICST